MLILEFGNLNNFRNFLTDTIRFGSRNTINNIMKKIESKLLFKANIDSQKNQLTPVALVDELQQKFAN